jgi:16S rRNA (cytosine967-C5)-methyltransferase
VNDIAALCSEQYGPAPLSADDRAALGQTIQNVPAHVDANVPAWLWPAFETLFGDRAVVEGKALAARAPIDLRVNTLKVDRAQMTNELKRFGAVEGPLVATSLRIAAPEQEQKHANVEAEPSHGLGWFEVQDTASQVAAALSGAKAGEQVADICAGAGGKTLALAALMQNAGRLVAHDVDRNRLRPIFERLARAGASCVEVIAAEKESELLPANFDCVVVDAPCSGSGTWRRKPETKWKLTRNVLERGAKLVKQGGRLVYFTCSLLPEENTDQVNGFLTTHKDFKIVPYATQWKSTIGTPPPVSADGSHETLLLTPAQHGTDGFFVAIMQRAK